MISYKYKLYKTDKTKYLDKMLAEACFMWNHALALQKRYYRLYGGYISLNRMKNHFAKRITRTYLYSMHMQEVLERLDMAYGRYFKHKSPRPPKFKNLCTFSSIVFKMYKGYKLSGNEFKIIKNNKRYKFFKSRDYEGIIKRVVVKRNKLGEYYIFIVTDAEPKKYGKTHNGAAVGIDFGLKTYLTLSDGTRYENVLYNRKDIDGQSKLQRKLCKCKRGGSNLMRKRKELTRSKENIANRRIDFHWKLAHDLCRRYDYILIEDLKRAEMNVCKKAKRKLDILAHSSFIEILMYVATKYDVVVHKIDHYYPSSKTCTCGYINKDLKLTDRQWTCPHCGTTHDRDLLAANNILRRGIYELESDSKTKKHSADGQSRYNPTITRVTA